MRISVVVIEEIAVSALLVGELPATIFTAIRPWISPDSVLSCWTNVVG